MPESLPTKTDNLTIPEPVSGEMTLEKFQEIVNRHSAFPGDLTYNILALAGEAGEVANQHKKALLVEGNPHFLTDETKPFLGAEQLREKKNDELGDALFYLIRCIEDNGATVPDIMRQQEAKLIAQSHEYGRNFLK